VNYAEIADLAMVSLFLGQIIDKSQQEQLFNSNLEPKPLEGLRTIITLQLCKIAVTETIWG